MSHFHLSLMRNFRSCFSVFSRRAPQSQPQPQPQSLLLPLPPLQPWLLNSPQCLLLSQTLSPRQHLLQQMEKKCQLPLSLLLQMRRTSSTLSSHLHNKMAWTRLLRKCHRRMALQVGPFVGWLCVVIWFNLIWVCKSIDLWIIVKPRACSYGCVFKGNEVQMPVLTCR